MYFHTQKRAERLIQLLIASVAVIATFGDTEIFRQFGSLYIDLTGSDDLINRFSIFNDTVQAELLNAWGVPLSTLIFTSGLLLLLDSILWSAEVITMPKMRPYLGQKGISSVSFDDSKFTSERRLELSKMDSDEKRLREDIKYNFHVLSQMDVYLTRSYTVLPLGLGLILISAIPYSAELANDISLLVYLLVLIFFTPIVIILSSIITNFSKIVNTVKKGGRLATDTYDKIRELDRHILTLNSLHFIVYLYLLIAAILIYSLSAIVTRAWIVEIGF